ncbi:MAG: carboxymuconolactone decarboxylase [Acidimicrobiia bacterium]|nr:carboxymuconolactone decarboxylase family protein [Acidimicrobiia bacterium]NNF64482.1 carboxymuconolactone decarboxylase [Acidimicrobiia bacterium]
MAVAVAHVTQCPHCIEGHTRQAVAAGATPKEIMESSWTHSASLEAGRREAFTVRLCIAATQGGRQSSNRLVNRHRLIDAPIRRRSCRPRGRR